MPGCDLASPLRLRHGSGGDRTLKVGDRTLKISAGSVAGHQQQCFASLQRPLVLPTFGLASSNTSMSRLVTGRCTLMSKAVMGRVRHGVKHPPPPAATARRSETARNLEGIL